MRAIGYARSKGANAVPKVLIRELQMTVGGFPLVLAYCEDFSFQAVEQGKHRNSGIHYFAKTSFEFPRNTKYARFRV